MYFNFFNKDTLQTYIVKFVTIMLATQKCLNMKYL
jgi:hypothetical protein